MRSTRFRDSRPSACIRNYGKPQAFRIRTSSTGSSLSPSSAMRRRKSSARNTNSSVGAVYDPASHLDCLRVAHLLHLYRRKHDILENGQMRKQIEALKHHPRFQPHLLQEDFLFEWKVAGLAVGPGNG